MSRDPLAPIWARLDTEPPVFFGDRPDPEFEGSRDRLVGAGFLRETAPAAIALCTACGGGHVRAVSWVEEPGTGARHAYLPCPNCGLVRVEPARLRRWAVDAHALLTAVFGAARGRAAVSELVPNRLWYLGTATWLGRSRQAYFTRSAHVHARPAVRAALDPHPRAVLFHPTEHARRAWGATTPNPSIALESVVALDPDGVRFDTALVDAHLADAGCAEPKPKAPIKRGPFAAKIETLVRELRAHVRAARDHAFSLRDLGRPPALLPRPTQKMLAASCGLSETDVSRCLNDPDAVLLQLLWETAADLDRVLSWDGFVESNSP